MQVQELYSQVAQLCFESSLEDDDRFYFAANRALLQVNSLRPAIASYVINHKPMENLIDGANFNPRVKTEDVCFYASDAKAYYFEANGNGEVFIERYDEAKAMWMIIGEVKPSGNRRFVPYRGFVKDGASFVSGKIRLRFSGDYLYWIKNVALYKHIVSDDAADIPAYEPYVRYDLNELDDFLSLASPPITEDEDYERLRGDYDIEGGRAILLPYSVSGCYKVLYKRRPAEIINDGTAASNESKIELDEELCSLMPVLIASYVYLDDEPEKAEYYLSLYRERAAAITAAQEPLKPCKMRTADNW
ncbi:MAG: hypothetical protein IJW93_06815 [Clostridia bacterium]|nr:hypothetical protein [Clostridia bacterium]